MGGDVVIGLIVFSILLVVNFMVITNCLHPRTIALHHTPLSCGGASFFGNLAWITQHGGAYRCTADCRKM